MKTDEQTIEHLDFEFAPPCECVYNSCGGTNVAEWRVLHVQCCEVKRKPVLWCTPCLDHKLSSTGLRHGDGGRGCGALSVPAYTHFERIERL